MHRALSSVPPGASAQEYIDAVDRIHFVFRGSADDSAAMLAKMEQKGIEVLSNINNPLVYEEVADAFRKKFTKNMNKQIPDVGDLVVFQNKGVKY